MNDIHGITSGFLALEKYGETEVNADDNRCIYAGPGDLTEDEFTPEERRILGQSGWEFDEMVGRWGYSLCGS